MITIAQQGFVFNTATFLSNEKIEKYTLFLKMYYWAHKESIGQVEL